MRTLACHFIEILNLIEIYQNLENLIVKQYYQKTVILLSKNGSLVAWREKRLSDKL